MAGDSLDAKRDALLEQLQGLKRVVVAFSGGVDSSLLALAARKALGDGAIAVTGSSATTATDELDRARAIAEEIGIEHHVLDTDEMNDPRFIANTPERCYFCKRIRFEAIGEFAAEREGAVVVEGSNADDYHDYRPGRRAVEELGVVSPLADAGFTKDEIRRLAKEWGLTTWDMPATPCLATRIAYNEPITPKRLTRIDRAEHFLRSNGFERFRVRAHKDDMARIEVQAEDFSRLIEPAFREKLAAELHEYGFRFIALDLEGFRPGSMNRVLADPEDNDD